MRGEAQAGGAAAAMGAENELGATVKEDCTLSKLRISEKGPPTALGVVVCTSTEGLLSTM